MDNNLLTRKVGGWDAKQILALAKEVRDDRGADIAIVCDLCDAIEIFLTYKEDDELP